ncbi:unnamed protein product [marine sediment metagenome]|uniref:Uncharacterized protein n=1 Tax=marine sediment metagenome TaxID=412755 RepID=X1VM99_9ZZZZ
MITNETADKIAEFSAKAITDQLSHQAYKQVVEKLCLPRCGKTPDAELCHGAERAHRLIVALLFDAYSESN